MAGSIEQASRYSAPIIGWVDNGEGFENVCSRAPPSARALPTLRRTGVPLLGQRACPGRPRRPRRAELGWM